MKKVIYNGGISSYSSVSDPSILVIGRAYLVERVEKANFQTNYVLKGLTGKFNSTWFDNPEYFAFSKEVPAVGKSIEVKLTNNQIVRINNPIIVSEVGKTTHKVQTEEDTYFVQVLR